MKIPVPARESFTYSFVQPL